MPRNQNSISARSNAVAVDGGFLDLLAQGTSAESDAPTFDNVQDSLYTLAAMYVQTATDNLNKQHKFSSGGLADSIIATPVRILGKVYEVNINIADFYKFVDQGVNGWAQQQGSPFSFKKFTGKSGVKNGKMVTAIRKWLIRESLQAKVVNAKKTPFKREKKQAQITDTSTRTAIIISKAIRKKGLKPTHFWTDAEKTVTAAAEKMFGSAIKIDIINSIYGKK